MASEGEYFIFDIANAWVGDGHEFDGNAIGPFKSAEAAVTHATRHTASWSPWVVGKVEVVHTYTPPDDT